MIIFSPSSRNCLQYASPKNLICGFWGRRSESGVPFSRMGVLCTCSVFLFSLFVFLYSWMVTGILGIECIWIFSIQFIRNSMAIFLSSICKFVVGGWSVSNYIIKPFMFQFLSRSLSCMYLYEKIWIVCYCFQRAFVQCPHAFTACSQSSDLGWMSLCLHCFESQYPNVLCEDIT